MNNSIKVSCFKALDAPKRLWREIAVAILLFLFASSQLSANEQNQPDKVGQVTLVIGQVIAHNKKGELHALKRGDSVYVEDIIETAAGGHIHLRFIDEGTVSLRPNSRLSIELYRYDRVNPKNSAIRFNLEAGVIRSISGKATEAAHDRFRLNTPITAIGVLGTDFVVRAESEKMWAGVYSGAIAIAPLNAQCSANGLGACAGATHLSETMGSVMLEFSGGRIREKIVPRDSTILPNASSGPTDSDKPNQSAAPVTAPAQTAGHENGRNSDVTSATTPGRITVAEMKVADVTTQVDESKQQAQPEPEIPAAQPEPVVQPEPEIPVVQPEPEIPVVQPEPEIPVVQPEPEIPVVQPEPVFPIEQPPIIIPKPPSPFTWARWGGQWKGDTMSQPYGEVRDGKKVTVGNKYFALFRTPSASSELQPRTGAYDFKLSQGQVHFVSNGPTWQKDKITPANLDAAALHVDFAQREFNTQLEMSNINKESVTLNMAGSIRDNGVFAAQNATGKVAGALSTEGEHAGMFFEREIQSGTFHGITDWIKH